MLITTSDVAKLLNLNIQTVYRFAKAGKLPSIKIGGALRFDREAIDKWLADHTTPSRQPTIDTPVTKEPTPTA